MRALRRRLDSLDRFFRRHPGPFGVSYALFEATDAFLYTSGGVTSGAPHVRDAINLKRVMIAVVVALLPPAAMAMYNTGLQANRAIVAGAGGPDPIRAWVLDLLQLGTSPDSVAACIAHGATYYLPIVAVTFAVGGGWEALFAGVRKHEISEGFLVTGMLFPLTLPPTVPLWQVALGISFGVVIGKEIFGGVGMNLLNPALTARAFLFFGYPAQITGDQVWVAADGHTGATALAAAAVDGRVAVGWWDAFLGTIPGSMGETSAAACLIGAGFMLLIGVASKWIMGWVVVGTVVSATTLNLIGSDTNPAFAMPFWWHMVIGGWAFGTVYMATDPVTAPYTRRGQAIYGAAIGVLIVVVRVINPAYPEGVMVGILLMNVFSPLIDHYVVRAQIRRRRKRLGR